ncbi:MAG: UDP-N-acetylmuramoyl-L-alanine--D-glutamate ligase [Proteobacteria bacterium]|nr:UDP-N-acetylmuramoyl-L-alanine--D-glutamate ligase [Pseudomonadota bacterium]
MDDLREKKVLVVGLGRSGVAAARFLAREGAFVTAEDLRPRKSMMELSADLERNNISLSLGRHDPRLALSSDLIVASPGVPLDLDSLRLASERGIPVVGEMELAVRRIARPVIAVTGTNGKTTTTALIGHLLSSAGIEACVAGNIGTPILEVVEEANRARFVVLEVSSFQMDTTPSLVADTSVWLNATRDHIDRHGSFEAYVASKAKLFSQMRPEGFGIYNAADGSVSRSVADSRCRLVPFDATGGAASEAQGDARSRGWFEGGDLCVQAEGLALERYPLSKARLAGGHNRENMLAALLAARLAGADPRSAAQGLATFEGLPHRVQLVAEHKGVRYYDDSKGTNVGATARAIEGFDEPIVLIAGGLSKGCDFSELAPAVRGRVKEAVLIGEAAPEMERALAPCTRIKRASSMDEAVCVAAKDAEPGDVVLLSPACASFDMFRDYAHRGAAFADAVRRLASGGLGQPRR